jgi:hypothetical protein
MYVVQNNDFWDMTPCILVETTVSEVTAGLIKEQ